MPWTVIGGVLCPGLDALPRLRVCGTPRDLPAAVESPPMMPNDVSAAWLTRVLFAGGHIGPQAEVPEVHGAMVHVIDSVDDISDDASVFRIHVQYGVARGKKLDAAAQSAARLPDSFILKLYDDSPTMTARGHNQEMLSRAPTPAHLPVCYWSCLDVRALPSRPGCAYLASPSDVRARATQPPAYAQVMSIVDPASVSLLSFLANEEWCAFDPEIKRRQAREAKAKRESERLQRQMAREAKDAERAAREADPDYDSAQEEEDDEEEEDEDEDSEDWVRPQHNSVALR